MLAKQIVYVEYYYVIFWRYGRYTPLRFEVEVMLDKGWRK